MKLFLACLVLAAVALSAPAQGCYGGQGCGGGQAGYYAAPPPAFACQGVPMAPPSYFAAPVPVQYAAPAAYYAPAYSVSYAAPVAAAPAYYARQPIFQGPRVRSAYSAGASYGYAAGYSGGYAGCVGSG